MNMIQRTEQVPTWARELFASVDAMDLDAIVARFADDVRFRFGNAQAVVGREDARAATAEFFGLIGGMSHQFREVWELGPSSVLITDVRYTRRDGRVVLLPAATLVHRRADGLVEDMQIFMDVTPAVA